MRRIVISFSVIAAFSVSLLFILGATKLPRQSAHKAAKASAAAKYGNADSITEDEMKIYDYFLASDQLEGRNLPSRGYDTAALYVASHLAEWGLKPGGSTSGHERPAAAVLHAVCAGHARKLLAEESKASLTGPRAVRSWRAGDRAELRAPPTSNMARIGRSDPAAPASAVCRRPSPLTSSGNLIFAGNGYVINKSNTNPYEGLDVRGKIIVVAGLPRELAAQQAAAAARRGAAGPNPLGENCTDYPDAGRIRREKWRGSRRQNRRLSATCRHGQSQRRARAVAQWTRFPGDEIPGARRVPRAPSIIAGVGNDKRPSSRAKK